jgi:predicted small lipoprotein YifL
MHIAQKYFRHTLSCVAITALFVFLAGCGEKPTPPQTPPPTPKLFQQERSALESAKGVEQIGAKNADNLKQEEEKQTK